MNSKRLALILSSLLLVLGFAAVLNSARRPDSALTRITFDSDILFMPALYRSLYTGGSLSSWQLSRAPYLFPDLPVYFVLNWLLGNFHVALLVYGALMFVVFLLLLTWLLRLVLGPDVDGLPIVLTTGALYLFAYSSGIAFFVYALFLNSHFGTIVNAALAAALELTLLKTRRGRRYVALCFGLLVLVVLATASDFLFVLQFVLPFLAASASAWVVSLISGKQLTRIAAIHAAGVVAGLVLYRLAALGQPENQFFSFSRDRAGEALSALLLIFKIWDANYKPALLIPVFFVVCASLIVFHVRRISQQLGGLQLNAFVLSAYSVFLPVVSIAGLVSLGWMEERYMVPLIVLATCFGWVFMLARRLTGLRTLWLMGIVLAFGLHVLPGLGEVSSLPWVFSYYPDYVRCVDDAAAQAGVHSGIAAYWQARQIEMLSHQGLRMAQVQASDLKPFVLTNSRDEYRRPIYDFIVLDTSSIESVWKISHGDVVSRFGEPAIEKDCGTADVMIYNRPSDTVFRGFFR